MIPPEEPPLESDHQLTHFERGLWLCLRAEECDGARCLGRLCVSVGEGDAVAVSVGRRLGRHGKALAWAPMCGRLAQLRRGARVGCTEDDCR
jgi:hypothetical protein